MTEWQPIETAPRDGTSVLLFGVTVYFSDKENDYCKYNDPVSAYWCGGGYWAVDYCSGWRISRPTHWMSLPVPPTTLGSQPAVSPGLIGAEV